MCQTEHAHSGCDSTFSPRNVNHVYLCVISLDIVLICFLASWFFNWLPELTGMPLKDLTGIFGLGASTTKPSTRQWTHHTYPHRIFFQDPIARHVGNMRWSWRKKDQKRYLQIVLSQSTPVRPTLTRPFSRWKRICVEMSDVGCLHTAFRHLHFKAGLTFQLCSSFWCTWFGHDSGRSQGHVQDCASNTQAHAANACKRMQMQQKTNI